MEYGTGINMKKILSKGDFEYTLPFYHKKCPLLAGQVLGVDISADSNDLFF